MQLEPQLVVCCSCKNMAFCFGGPGIAVPCWRLMITYYGIQVQNDDRIGCRKSMTPGCSWKHSSSMTISCFWFYSFWFLLYNIYILLKVWNVSVGIAQTFQYCLNILIYCFFFLFFAPFGSNLPLHKSMGLSNGRLLPVFSACFNFSSIKFFHSFAAICCYICRDEPIHLFILI